MLSVIIPIGPPGSGKSTLNQELISKNIPNYYSSSRDDLYSEIKKTNSSRKTRKILYDKMIEFFNLMIEKSKTENVIVYLDSCNAREEIRNQFIEYLKPDRIIYINFRYSNSDLLLERTLQRKEHPTFPPEAKEQLEIINKIVSSITFQETEVPKSQIINITDIKQYINLIKHLEELF
jgi:adenylate kinase family enzyme